MQVERYFPEDFDAVASIPDPDLSKRIAELCPLKKTYHRTKNGSWKKPVKTHHRKTTNGYVGALNKLSNANFNKITHNIRDILSVGNCMPQNIVAHMFQHKALTGGYTDLFAKLIKELFFNSNTPSSWKEAATREIQNQFASLYVHPSIKLQIRQLTTGVNADDYDEYCKNVKDRTMFKGRHELLVCIYHDHVLDMTTELCDILDECNEEGYIMVLSLLEQMLHRHSKNQQIVDAVYHTVEKVADKPVSNRCKFMREHLLQSI